MDKWFSNLLEREEPCALEQKPTFVWIWARPIGPCLIGGFAGGRTNISARVHNRICRPFYPGKYSFIPALEENPNADLSSITLTLNRQAVSGDSMLSIKNVHKRFGNVHAMNDITLDLAPGLFGLLGPNGAGKSTLMRTLATLQSPDEGMITYNGSDIKQDPDVVRATLGYLPQDFGVYPRMSAIALLDHFAILKGIADKAQRKEQVESLLQMVNLWTHKSAAVSTFSGGMRQRFGIAQALLGDPHLIIVDEPTAGLDPLERQRFLDILSRAGDDKIIILSTHIIEDVRDLCTDMGVMGNGKLIVRGAPEDLVEKIQGQVWTQRFENDEIVDDLKAEMSVLSTRRLRGATVVSALSPKSPGSGWEPRNVLLEDAYFAYLNGFMSATGGVHDAA